jgi:hypothetical protein
MELLLKCINMCVCLVTDKYVTDSKDHAGLHYAVKNYYS